MAGIRQNRVIEVDEERSEEMRPGKVSWDAPLQDSLTLFLTSVPGVLAIVVADRNGLPVASAMRDKPRADLVAVSAMAVPPMAAGRPLARSPPSTPGNTGTAEGEPWKGGVSPTPPRLADALVT